MKPARFASLLVFALSAWAQGIDYAKIEILTDKIGPNLYLLSGSAGADPGHQDAAGGRIAVLAGPDGIFMVDAQYAQITYKVVAAIRKISPEPIRYVPEPGDIFFSTDPWWLARYGHKMALSGPPHHCGIVFARCDGSPALLEAGPHNTLRVRTFDAVSLGVQS